MVPAYPRGDLLFILLHKINQVANKLSSPNFGVHLHDLSMATCSSPILFLSVGVYSVCVLTATMQRHIAEVNRTTLSTDLPQDKMTDISPLEEGGTLTNGSKESLCKILLVFGGYKNGRHVYYGIIPL